MNSVNNDIPFVPENTIDPAAGLNLAINTIDALLQVRVISVGTNAPPASPTDGDRYIVGTAPTGAWGGQSNRMARWLGGGWQFFDAAIAVNLADDSLYIHGSTGWLVVGAP